MRDCLNRVIGKLANDERLIKEKEKIENIKMKIGSTLSMEGITGENQIQILTQTPFFIPV